MVHRLERGVCGGQVGGGGGDGDGGDGGGGGDGVGGGGVVLKCSCSYSCSLLVVDCWWTVEAGGGDLIIQRLT